FLIDSCYCIPYVTTNCKHVYHLYVLRVQERENLRVKLLDFGISTSIHYPRCLHLQPAFKNLGYSQGDFPSAELAAEEVLSLPLYPELSKDQASYVAEALLDNL
ncbi:MAG: DegT/DnrJ/EryC1/StrS family aminotransferase, partial [Desulfamplus sp.]|nr:DegT/DnrJ/EryC1/StrS family aminotransferase [Desulfamplus sp.]